MPVGHCSSRSHSLLCVLVKSLMVLCVSMRRSVSFLIVVDEALDQIVLAPLLAEAVVGAELFQLFDSVGAV